MYLATSYETERETVLRSSVVGSLLVLPSRFFAAVLGAAQKRHRGPPYTTSTRKGNEGVKNAWNSVYKQYTF